MNNILFQEEIPVDLWNMLFQLDTVTFQHSMNCYKYAKIVEEEMDIKDHLLSKAALFHDIGKFYISQKLLAKPCSLSVLERELINCHSYLSFQILKDFGIEDKVCQLVLFHHHYKPLFLGKSKNKPELTDEIKELALILKTIDVFDALTSDRSYHKGCSLSALKKEFREIEHDKRTLNLLIKTQKERI